MEDKVLYCVPVVVDDICYTTQSVYASSEDEAKSLAVLLWKNAKYDPSRQIYIVRKHQ